MLHELTGETLKLIRAQTIILSSYPPHPVDAAIYHGRGYNDEGNLHKLTAEMLREGVIRRIALTTTMGERVGSKVSYEASPGLGFNIIRLVEEGVPSETIVYPDRRIPNHHTRGETDEFLRLAQQKGWRSGVLPAHPHQLLRIYGGWVKAMEQTGYLMELYSAFSLYTPWQEQSTTNQGLNTETRFDNIEGELRRYLTYAQKGDVATPDELLDYLMKREQSLFDLGRGSERLTRNLPEETGNSSIQA